MRSLLFLFAIFVVCFSALEGKIIKTAQIEEILPEVKENTLVLFNIAEVLMDTEMSLGTQAWRKYVRSRVDSKTHDALSLYVFQQVPPKTPENATARILNILQENGILTFGFTSRGRDEWYSTQIAGIDLLTEKLLRQLDIDFSQNRPFSISQLDSLFGEYFHEGIIYATNGQEKGEMLLQFLEAGDFHPAKIIFVDDKVDSLTSVEEALKKQGIPFTGFAYSRTALDHVDFDPMIAHIQLDWLLAGQILTDQQAKDIKANLDPQFDHESYFWQIIEKWKTVAPVAI